MISYIKCCVCYCLIIFAVFDVGSDVNGEHDNVLQSISDWDYFFQSKVKHQTLVAF